jgi:predicted oxidoreductase
VTGADVIVVGAGLAGMVATCELLERGCTVMLVEQEPQASFGGQAFWSLGGLFLVNTPEQRRLGIRDSLDLARDDWAATAEFDRPEDQWARQWADRYVEFAAGEARSWLRAWGLRFFPLVGWAERKFASGGPGNSVPRFHVTWGSGPGVVNPFAGRIREGVEAKRVRLCFRHRVDALIVESGAVVGVHGATLERSPVLRGESSSRTEIGKFEFRARSIVVTSGGIGGNLDLVREVWPASVGPPPSRLVTGVPAHVDGRMLEISRAAGGSVVNADRMWHYTEGLHNWNPIWPNHGIRILPGPSSLWLDPSGNRLRAPFLPGFDTLGTLRHICSSGFDHTWFVLNQAVMRREVALSGSEQNPDITDRNVKLLLGRLFSRKLAPGPVEAFKRRGVDFVAADSVGELVAGMRRLEPEAALDSAAVQDAIRARDASIGSPGTDLQIDETVRARRYVSERIFRVTKPAPLLDPADRPLIAARLTILTRKSLGGLQTNDHSQVLDQSGRAVPGLFAAGEVAGFGGGGMHGYRALEGTFLGGCLFSGRIAGRAAAE